MITQDYYCCVCQKSLYNFDINYVDEFHKPKYYNNLGKIFCSPECSTDYKEVLTKEKIDERT